VTSERDRILGFVPGPYVFVGAIVIGACGAGINLAWTGVTQRSGWSAFGLDVGGVALDLVILFAIWLIARRVRAIQKSPSAGRHAKASETR
jgi:hypothetical protein